MKWLRPLLYIIDISHFTNVYEIFKTFTLYNWYITLYKICNVIKTLSVLNSEKYSKLLESVSFQHRVQLSRWIEKPVAKKQFNRHSFLLLLLFFVIFIITTIAGSRTCCKIIVWLSPPLATPSPSPAGSSWSRWWTNCAFFTSVISLSSITFVISLSSSSRRKILLSNSHSPLRTRLITSEEGLQRHEIGLT